jgi:uncharacterized protein YacL
MSEPQPTENGEGQEAPEAQAQAPAGPRRVRKRKPAWVFVWDNDRIGLLAGFVVASCVLAVSLFREVGLLSLLVRFAMTFVIAYVIAHVAAAAIGSVAGRELAEAHRREREARLAERRRQQQEASQRAAAEAAEEGESPEG